VARVNWLTGRVQAFRLRKPILQAIESALAEARRYQEGIQDKIAVQAEKAR
jgi:hypothetical protein